MELVEEITSGDPITYVVPSKDFEILNFKSERTINEDYRSLTHNFAQEFNLKLNNIIYSKFKDAKYKALIISDESKEDIKIKKIIILLQNKEIIDFVKNSLTQSNYKIEYDILEQIPNSKVQTLFEQAGQFLCDQIHNYLMCEFNFNGITKLNVSGHAGEVQSFNITASGKGTTDFIVEGLKLISQYIEANKYAYYSNADEIFNILEAYFKS